MKNFWIAAILFLSFGVTASAEEFIVVANSAVSVQSISRNDLKAIFVRSKTSWPDGKKIVPVDQVVTSGTRAAFSTTVHGRNVAAMQSYWRQQIFSGREVPPVEKSSDLQVLDFVRETPGAVGYVSKTAVTRGVQIVAVQ